MKRKIKYGQSPSASVFFPVNLRFPFCAISPHTPPTSTRQHKMDTTGAVATETGRQGEAPRLYLALDVETSGPNVPFVANTPSSRKNVDALLSIGYCAMLWCPRTQKAHLAGHGRCVLDVGVEQAHQMEFAAHDWAKLWEVNGWDARTWDEFWSCNAITLSRVMAHPTRLSSYAAMATWLDNLLGLFERQYNVAILLDTTAMDSVWLCTLLMAHGFRGLQHTRAGRYRPAVIQVDDVCDGMMHVAPTLSPATLRHRRGSWREDRLALFDNEGTDMMPSGGFHVPEYDAFAICANYALFLRRVQTAASVGAMKVPVTRIYQL